MDLSTSTDVLVEILLRLPTSARRRARLVCRLWREAVDDRTTEMRSRAARPLLWNTRTGVAYVYDLPSSSSSPWSCTTEEVWRSSVPCTSSYWDADVQLVGTCNGLLCVCDNGERTGGGRVTLVNPATGETLALPMLPCTDPRPGGGRRSRRWDKAYSFGYHPTSGRYKLVHVPCRFDDGYFDLDGVCDFDALQVLEMGEEASWREVPAPARSKCNLEAGVASIDGATYWVTEGGGEPRVVSLSLDDDERVVTFAMPSAALSAGPGNYRLTEVRGRLGVVVHDRSGSTTGVWVLEEKDTWTRRYSIHSQDLTQPHFVYGDEVVTHDGSSLYGHRRQSGPNLLCDVMKINAKDQGTLVARVWGETCFCRTFTYVQTTEPLRVYAAKPPSTTALQGEGDLHRAQGLEHAQLGGLQGEADLHRTQRLEHANLGGLQAPPRAAVAAPAPMTLARVEPKALALVLLLTFVSLLLAFSSTCMHK